MIECPHGDDPSICPPCQGPPLARHRGREWGPPFLARFAGSCRGCGYTIEVDQQIRGAADGDSPYAEYRHADCIDG